MQALNQNKMKQTAVDWLQEALEDTILTHEQIMQTIGLFEQAKAMEKEQIMDAVSAGHDYCENGKVRWMGEQYYNETYKSE